MAKMIINGEVYSGSTNYASAITYIKEDGTKSTVQKVLDNRPVNNNILINSNFANPVNQRGVVSPYTAPQHKTYWIDRWKIKGVNGQGIFSLVDKGIKIEQPDGEKCTLTQHIEASKDYFGKKATLSIYINGVVHSLTTTFPSTMPTIDDFYVRSIDFDDKTALAIGISASLQCFYIELYINGSGSRIVEWAKLELGEVATPYVSRLYEEELELCQRYYQIIHNNLFPWSATTSDMVFHQHFKPMRITPTISIIEANLYLENQLQSGFTFSNNYKTDRRFSLYAKKSSHGLKGKAYVGLFLNVALDAEL